MKVLIALALVSVALANPAVQPVRLPAPELPALETMPYVPEPIDISPAFVNFDLSALGEIVQVVENAEAAYEAVKVANLEEIVPAFDGEVPAEPVKFVDSEIIEEEIAAEELAAPSADEIAPEAVNFVDFAPVPAETVIVVENIEAAEELVAPADEEILPTPVKIVDVAENIDAPVVANFESDAQDKVRVVDVPFRYPGKVFDNPMLR